MTIEQMLIIISLVLLALLSILLFTILLLKKAIDDLKDIKSSLYWIEEYILGIECSDIKKEK